MSLLLETISLENRQLQHLSYHNRRARKVRRELYGLDDAFDLADLIRLPSHLGKGQYKCRVIYGASVESVEFEPYTMRPVQSIRLVRDDGIDYQYKYADRSRLRALFARRGKCDDVLIVKNGLLTDASYSNIALYDGREWVTPEKPLLRGTARQRLLEEGVLRERKVAVEDLRYYETIRLINAMIPWEEGIEIPVRDGVFT